MGTQVRAQMPLRSSVIAPRGRMAGVERATAFPARSVGPASRHPAEKGRSGGREAGNGHAFEHVAIFGGRQASEPAAGAKISASGDPTITIDYTPSSSDKSTKIVFIQTMRYNLDGAAVKPSEVASVFKFKDAVMTGDHWCVDFFDGEKDPYYNGDDASDIGTQGNATSKPPVNSHMTDTPNHADKDYAPGKTKSFWEFRTASFSAAGADQGTYYDYVDWTYSKEKGKTSSLKVGSTGTGNPGKQFQDAVDLWCKKFGFALPKPAAAPTPAPPPTPAPAPGVFPPSPPPPGPKP